MPLDTVAESHYSFQNACIIETEHSSSSLGLQKFKHAQKPCPPTLFIFNPCCLNKNAQITY